MNSADETPKPFERVAAIEIGRASAAPLEDGKAKAVEFVQRRAFEHACQDRGNFARGEARDEHMLLENRRMRPVLRPIELPYDRRTEHALGREAGKGRRVV